MATADEENVFTTTELALGHLAVPAAASGADELAQLQDAVLDATPTPCAARPSTAFLHRDGPCRCFVGGPAPEFPDETVRPAYRFAS